MISLGINDGHDAGIAILDGNEVLFASNEERFSRNKMHSGFPVLSLQGALSQTGLSVNDIDVITFAGYGPIYVASDYDFDNRQSVSLLRRFFLWLSRSGIVEMDGNLIVPLHRSAARLQRYMKTRRQSVRLCREMGFEVSINHEDHHECHAASAYYTSPFPDATILTLDGGGDGLSGTIWRAVDGHMECLSVVPKIHSAGNFWDYVTYICGFSPMRHGGKITGLAAYSPCQETYEIFKKYYAFKDAPPRWENKKNLFWNDAVDVLRSELNGYSIEQIAWGAQKLLEEVVVEIVKAAVALTGIGKVALAGGVFANVRLNQVLNELPQVESIFVHPHMGDGGIALGAAFCGIANKMEIRSSLMSHAYWGFDIQSDKIPVIAKSMGVCAEDLEHPALFVAQALSKHEVVGVVRGKAEYGPRSLCNRSIIAEPTDTTMMDWLNERLDRTEFMPFAPVIMEEFAAEYFNGYPKSKDAAKFMTLCYGATDLCKIKAPGVVHIDGTARPQVVNTRNNQFMHEVLQNYYEISGLPLCVNTSFNRHEEPIVNTIEDAIAELVAGRVDILIINDYWIRLQ